MVQQGAVVYEEGNHPQKLHFAFTYCIFYYVNVVCAYSVLQCSYTTHAQLSDGKTCLFEGVPNARAGVDVIFFDCSENLPMPGVSKSPHVVPT